MPVAWESNQSYWAAAGLPYIAGIVITPKFTIAQLRREPSRCASVQVQLPRNSMIGLKSRLGKSVYVNISFLSNGFRIDGKVFALNVKTTMLGANLCQIEGEVYNRPSILHSFCGCLEAARSDYQSNIF